MKTNDPKPITLIVTIYPPKKNARRVVVSGAPEGEMPVILDGLFPDRHALLDRVFALVLKRDPQVVTIAEPKTGKAKSITAGADDDEEAETTEEQDSDQLVKDVLVSPSTGSTEPDEELPEIEGDVTGASPEAVALFENQLNITVGALDSAAIEPEEEVVNDGEQD